MYYWVSSRNPNFNITTQTLYYSISMNCIFKRQIILISVLLYNRRQKKEEGESKKLYQKHLFRRQQRIEATISDRQTASEAEE